MGDRLLFPAVRSKDSIRSKARNLTSADPEYYHPHVPCDKCPGLYEVPFFTRYRNGGLSRICKGCRNLQKKIHSQNFQWKRKLAISRVRHAKKMGKTSEQLERDFLWNDDAANEMKKEYSTGSCPDCLSKYTDLGESSLSIDILVPETPHWGLNTRLCCIRCNSSAQDKNAGDRITYLRNMKRWRDCKEKSSVSTPNVVMFE